MKRALVLASLALAPMAWGASVERRQVERPEPHGAPPAVIAAAPPKTTPPRSHPPGFRGPIVVGAPVHIVERPWRETPRAHPLAPGGAPPDEAEAYPKVMAIAGDFSGPRPHTFSYHGRTLQARQGGLYAYPIGYVSQRWRPGQSLPEEFLEPVFYYLDWQDLGLPAPPPDARWIRYGHDIFLANIVTGEILDTAYDAII